MKRLLTLSLLWCILQLLCGLPSDLLPMTTDQDRALLRPGKPGGILRVAVGCGPKDLDPHWWNTDLRSFPGIDEELDATEPWPEEWQGLLSHIYCEHFVEHLTLDGALRFSQHAHDALRVGGRIRLSTPSLEWVMATHFNLSEARDEKVGQQTFGINRAFHGWGHQFLYSRVLLARLVAAVGFEHVSFHEYGKSPDPTLNNRERHGGYTVDAQWPSLWIIEAQKTRSDADVDGIKRFSEVAEINYLRYVRSGH